jgi:hypothetical protein
MATMLVVILSSCIKENIPEFNENNQIRFELQNGGWNAIKSKTSVRHLSSPSFKDTLYVHISSTNEEVAHTKANSVSTENFHKSLGLTAFRYSGDWTESLCPDYIYNEELTEDSNWTSSHRWPGSLFNIKFFAYAPYGCENLTLSGKEYCGTPLLTYEVPDKAEDQTDLTVATTGELSGASIPSASLSFSHILTGVRILTGENIIPGKITRISINGIYGKGTYSYATNSWETDAIKSFTQNTDIAISGNAGESIMDEALTYMLIPQTLPEGASLTIDFVDNLTHTTHQLQANIAGIVLPIGEMVTFRIETSSLSVESVLEVSVPTFAHSGGSSTCYIKSYSTLTTSSYTTTVASPWVAEFVEEDGNGGYRVIDQPEWITLSENTGNGGMSNNMITVTIAPQVMTLTTPHDDILKAASPVTGIYDLSTKGGTESMNTANCYIVNAPGTYSFPLVYGNAIKNGNANPEAYTQPLSQISGKFVNHRNVAITDPYIYNNASCVPDNAVLSWQDGENLVSNIRLNSEKTEILFDVDAASIKQGNAVISIRDASNTIMWNWHIWVTDYESGDGLTTLNVNDKDHHIMPNTVGFCYNPTEYYPRSEAILKFTQKDVNKDYYVTIVRDERSTEWGHSAIYQWGVPCPMLPGSAVRNASGNARNKAWYDGSGKSHTENFPKLSGGNSIANRIKNPVGIIQSFSNSYGSISNMWNAGLLYNANKSETYKTEETNIQKKTIYDPCPRGFTIAPHYLLVYISKLSTKASGGSHYCFKSVWINEEAGEFFRYPVVPTRGPTSQGEVEDSIDPDFWSSQYRMHMNNSTSGCCDEYCFAIMAIKE